MRRNGGFTLLEVLVASFIFLGAMAAFTPNLLGTLKRHNHTALATGAFHVAQEQLDTLRQQNVSALPSSGTIGPTHLSQDGRSYAVYTTFCATPSLCVSADTREIRVQVMHKQEILYEVQTVFTQLK